MNLWDSSEPCWIAIDSDIPLQCAFCCSFVRCSRRIDNIGSKVAFPAAWTEGLTNESGLPTFFIVNSQLPSEFSSPMFGEVLRAIHVARGARRGRLDIHLASNGMLLDADRVRALVELGVTSVMVSLDGATPATNDKIRVLGDLHRVLDHLAGAIAWRERERVDLRLGISTVVGRHNVGELAALGRTCAALGLDWLKLEETYPINGFSRADFLAPDSVEVLTAMASLKESVAGSDLVLVDHLAPPAGCVCSGDAAALAFRAADDFANRFDYRPCRATWEQAAIDPDGNLHLVDYAGPILGNLLDTPILDLWNTPAATSARAAALAAGVRPCGRG